MEDYLSKEFYKEMKQIVKGRVSADRFEHIKSVAKTCKWIAKTYNLDVKKAKLAGLLHDWDKGLTNEEEVEKACNLGLASQFTSWEMEHLPNLLHGPTAATEIVQKFNNFPSDVAHAISVHTTACESMNELDMCLLLNGIPLFTFELKNEGSEQNYTHGIHQYKSNRDPNNRMLRNCLVHFVMDNQYVFMTTHLNGEETTFLPFNQETVNPPVEGDYPTCYMWRQILQADSVLDLLENFIKRYEECYEDKETKEEKKRVVVIFPRFHQLRAVRKLRSLVREEGPGNNYLIQHSAGSGKTKTMAWLAHQLANMTNSDNSAIFDSIIMVTDRIVLNRNMAEDVVNFEVTAGKVKDIRKGSRKLADALNGENRIIISTVQKFAFALDYLKHEKSKKYAIIVDEAHTAVGNEAAKDLVSALSTKEDLKAIEDYDPDEYDSPLDALMAQMQSYRKMMKHISYFA